MQPTPAPRPDTIDEMTAALSDNNDVGYVTDMTTESSILPPTVAPTADSFHKKVVDSNDRLCFVSYKGANTLRPRWYLVQILLDGDNADRPPGTYHVEFFAVTQMICTNLMTLRDDDRTGMR